MALTRRDFLAASAVLCSAPLASVASTPKGNIILGGGQYRHADSEQVNYVLSLIDLTRGRRQLTPMTFLAHGIHRNPTDQNRLAIFEKKGPNACEFDLATQTIVRSIPIVSTTRATDKRYFYGHGSYSIDGQVLFSTETELDGLNGLIGIRNSRDLAYLGEFPSYGKEPHECKLIDGGKTLVVTNGGGVSHGAAPSVAYIDINSQQLLEKVELTNAKLNTGHLAISDKGELVVISAPRVGLSNTSLGGVSIRPEGEQLQPIASPQAITQRMRGEALSVAIHTASGVAAVTHPDGGMVTFWSIASRSLIKIIELPHPRGVELTVDQREFVISFGREASLARIPLATLEFDPAAIFKDSYITGSHIYNWSREMVELYYPRSLI